MTAYVKSSGGGGGGGGDDGIAARKMSLVTSSLPVMSAPSSVASSSSAAAAAASPSPESKNRRHRGSHQRSESLGGGFVQQISALSSLAPRVLESSPSAALGRGSHRVLPSKSSATVSSFSSVSSTPVSAAQILSGSPVLAHKTEDKVEVRTSPVMRSSGGRARSKSRSELVDHPPPPPPPPVVVMHATTAPVQEPPPMVSVSSGSSIRRSPSVGNSEAVLSAAIDAPPLRGSRRSATIHGGMANVNPVLMPPSALEPIKEGLSDKGGSSIRDSASRRRRTGTAKKPVVVEDGLEGKESRKKNRIPFLKLLFSSGVSAEVLASVEAEIAMLLRVRK